MIFKTRHLPRYKEIGKLLWRHGRSRVFRDLAEISEFAEEPLVVDSNDPSPEDLVNDLERMGPTFVKLGQILSSRSDLLPEPYLRALSRLQNNVEPFPFEAVKAAVEEELGVRISKAFLEFDEKPLAAASLGQVHRAVLRDGREVAVKVQRPNIRKQIAEDFEVLEEIATFTDHHTVVGRRHRFLEILEQFRKALAQELDYQREAANLSALGANLQEFPHIIIVQPIADYTTRGVLTMTFLHGNKLTDLSPVVRLDMDGAKLADELFRAYLKQILVDGLFHADPHPGNVILTPNYCIGLLDLGMVGRITPGMQESLIKLLLAISEGRPEDASRTAIAVSETTEQFDEAAFKRRVGALIVEIHNDTLRQMDMGRVLLDVSRIAGETGLRCPSELTMLGKTLLQLQEIGHHLHPSFNPQAAIREHVSAILKQRLRKDFTPGNLFSSILDMKEFLGQFPSRITKIMETLGKGQIELRLRRDDTLFLLDGLQKIANRIAAGLLLGSLIVGAALLMRIRTSFELFGYPGLGILCFLTAAAGGLWLLFDIFFRDTKRPPNPP